MHFIVKWVVHQYESLPVEVENDIAHDLDEIVSSRRERFAEMQNQDIQRRPPMGFSSLTATALKSAANFNAQSSGPRPATTALGARSTSRSTWRSRRRVSQPRTKARPNRVKPVRAELCIAYRQCGTWLTRQLVEQALSARPQLGCEPVPGRAAWAHDWQNTPQASAACLGTSPIATLIINDAEPAADLGVVTAGAELRMASGWG